MPERSIDRERLTDFLRGLKAHNNKPWFDARREEYQELREQFTDDVQRLILDIGKFDSAVQFQIGRQAMYRINRDIRFSNDKKPYKTNFGAGINPGGKKGELPGYHIHLDFDGTMMVAGGLYLTTPEQVDRIRTSIDRSPKTIMSILKAPAFKKTFGQLDDGDKLKRPPRGYAAEHPSIEVLKLKHFAAWAEVKPKAGDWVPQAATMAKALYPLIAYLRQVSS